MENYYQKSVILFNMGVFVINKFLIYEDGSTRLETPANHFPKVISLKNISIESFFPQLFAIDVN